MGIGFAAAAAFVALALPRQSASLPKEWNQSRGNAANTAAVDVAPLKAQPVERWRLECEAVIAGPVVAAQKLYAIVQQKKKWKLVALDPANGKQLASVEVTTAGEPFGIAASEGLVLLATTEALEAWRLAGSELRSERVLPADFGGEPGFLGATPLVTRANAAGLQTVDAAGKLATLAAKGFARAGACLDDKLGGKPAKSLALLGVDAKADKLLLQRMPITATAPLKLGAAEIVWSGPTFANPARTPLAWIAPVQGKDGADWFLWMDDTRGGGFLRKDGYKPFQFARAPAISGSRLFGFVGNGRLVRVDAGADAEGTIAGKEELPAGAQVGAASIARDTLYLGNWAIDIDRKRILWCLPAIEADGPAIPAGDELLVIRTKKGALIGFGGDGSSGGGAATAASGGDGKSGAAGGGAAPSRTRPTPSPDLPGSKPGIVRADGLFLPGKPSELDGGRFKLEPPSGPAIELDAIDVALVDDGTNARRVGEEQPLFDAFVGTLELRHAEALVAVFERWRAAKLPDECRRVLEEAGRHGLPRARIDELQAAIASLAPGAGGAPRAAAEEAEADARESGAKGLLKAARWCAAHDAKTAATVLLARAIALAPADPPDRDLADEWIPADFPRAETPDATLTSWFAWAEALLPSGGTFATLDDTAKRRLSFTKFATDSVYLRTRNILLISKEKDRSVLGPLLVRGEATIRALQKILGPSPDGLPTKAPLEVRLFQTRADYLADYGSGSRPPGGSAGFYSPGDSISRFYSEQSSKKDDPISNELQHVFAHELTHHFTNQRWVWEKGSSPDGGYWMVEGFAEFAAGQALEIGRYGDKFDDPTVEAIDKAAAAARAGKLIGLSELLALTNGRVWGKENDAEFGSGGFQARLKHTLTDAYLDKRGVFYAESTALTFFVMNRCKDGRAIHKRWLEAIYRGKQVAEPWKELGFADSAAMNKAFQEFLAGI